MRRILPVEAALLFVICLSFAACRRDDTAAPLVPMTSPAPPVSPPASPTYTISGVVFEHTAGGRHPAPGVLLRVLSEDVSSVTSDGDGRYTASIRGDAMVIVPDEGQGYLSPCPAGKSGLSTNPNRVFNVDIVSAAVLSTSGMPNSYPLTALYTAGQVFELTSAGQRPVGGALVALGDAKTLSYSTTLSDSLGKYVVCSAPPGSGTDQSRLLAVTKDGYVPAAVSIILGYDEGGRNVELSKANK